MSNKLGPEQHKAWAIFITRHSKVFNRIEEAVARQKNSLALHLYDVLLALKNTPKQRLRLSEIADRIVTSRSALSRSVQKLEKMGYLEREKCEDDGRGQFAVLTHTGLKVLNLTWPHYETAIQENFGISFTAAEAKELSRLLLKLKY